MTSATQNLKYPWFPPPIPGQKMGLSKRKMHPELNKALWELFWQHSVEKQIDLFRERPNMASFFQNCSDYIECIRRPENLAPVATRIAFHIPKGFPDTRSVDPYYSLQEWFAQYPEALRGIERRPYRIYKARVGPKVSALQRDIHSSNPERASIEPLIKNKENQARDRLRGRASEPPSFNLAPVKEEGPPETWESTPATERPQPKDFELVKPAPGALGLSHTPMRWLFNSGSKSRSRSVPANPPPVLTQQQPRYPNQVPFRRTFFSEPAVDYFDDILGSQNSDANNNGIYENLPSEKPGYNYEPFKPELVAGPRQRPVDNSHVPNYKGLADHVKTTSLQPPSFLAQTPPVKPKQSLLDSVTQTFGRKKPRLYSAPTGTYSHRHLNDYVPSFMPPVKPPVDRPPVFAQPDPWTRDDTSEEENIWGSCASFESIPLDSGTPSRFISFANPISDHSVAAPSSTGCLSSNQAPLPCSGYVQGVNPANFKVLSETSRNEPVTSKGGDVIGSKHSHTKVLWDAGNKKQIDQRMEVVTTQH